MIPSPEPVVLPVLEPQDSAGRPMRLFLWMLLAFLLLMLTSIAILYFSNANVKTFVDSSFKKINMRPAAPKETVDPRVKELSTYYLSLEPDIRTQKMLAIQKQDSRLFNQLSAQMLEQDPAAGKLALARVQAAQTKKNLLDTEYQAMKEQQDKSAAKTASHYASLGLRGAIETLERRLQNEPDTRSVTQVVEKMQPAFAAKALYYLNPVYSQEIQDSLQEPARQKIGQALEKYQAFVNQNAALGPVMEKLSEKEATASLSQEELYSVEALGVIFSAMDASNAARILNDFKDAQKINAVLAAVEEIEMLDSQKTSQNARVIANTLKVYKNYDRDADILRKAYEKMKPQDLAEIVDKSIQSQKVYRSYQIEGGRTIDISEQDMMIKVLKNSKPTLVSGVLSALKNSNRSEKALLISNRIGIALP